MSKYRVRYCYTAAPNTTRVMDLGATGPIQALNQFHSTLQVDQNVKPELYSVVSLALAHSPDAMGRVDGDIVESIFDLPKTPNPRLVKVEQSPTVVQSTMFDV